jgi:hypothetical protein
MRPRRLTDRLAGQRPTAAAPVVFMRVNSLDYIVRTPIVNGDVTKDFTEFHVRNKNIGGNMLNLAGMSSFENWTRRVQSLYATHISVFEYAHRVAQTTDGLGVFGFIGNDHGFVSSTGLTCKMDGGSDLTTMAIGVPVQGTSLVIAQTYNALTPKDSVAYGTISDTHTFTSAGCTVDVVITPSRANAANQNSYSAMFPFTEGNRAQFDSQSVIDVSAMSIGQGANQGQRSTLKVWHTDRPDLIAECTLVNGNPGTPDVWTNVTAPDTFIDKQSGYAKGYLSYRSGSTALAAVTSTHKTLYRLRK